MEVRCYTPVSISKSVFVSIAAEPARSPGTHPPGLRPTPTALRRLAGWLGWLLLGVLILVAALWLLFRHWIWPSIDQWRPQIEQTLSRALDAPVSIGELASGFDGLRPSLRARSVRVGGPQDAPLTVEEVFAVLSLRALVRGEPGLSSLELVRPVIRVERIENRRFSVAGALIDLDRTGASSEFSWLLGSRSISVRNARIDWRDRMGSEPVVTAGIDLLSTNDSGRHHFSLRAPAVGAGLQGLELAADFTTAAVGDLADWRKWRGEAYASAMHVQFVPLVRMLRGWLLPTQAGQPFVLGGSGPVKAWARFDNGQLGDVLVKAFTEAIDLRVGANRIGLRSLSLEASAKLEDQKTLTIIPRRLAAVDSAGFSFALDEQAEQRIVVQLDSLMPVAGRLTWRGFDAGRLLEALRRLPLPDPWTGRLAQVTAGGRINGAALSWDAAGQRYSVTFGFERLSLQRVERRGAPPSRWPSFANLSGEAEFSDRSGQIRLDAAGAAIRLPGLLAEPVIPLASLAGVIGWRVEPKDEAGGGEIVELHAAGLSFANADMAGSFSGRWRGAGRSALGEIDLAGSLSRVNAARVGAYLPLAVDARVRGWVSRAVSATGASETRVRLRGDLAEFPFRGEAPGEFRIETRLEQAALAFSPDWPPVNRVRGRLVFERAGMELRADTAEIQGVALRDIHARIEELARPTLVIDGRAQGSLGSMIGFVDASPLRRSVDPLIRSWQPEGNAELSLRLDVGLGAGGSTDYQGRLVLAGNQLRVAPHLPVLSDIAGDVSFDPRGIRAPSLSARLLGGAVQASLTAADGAAMRLDAKGSAAGSELLGLIGRADSRFIAGSADWQAGLEIGPQGVAGVLRSSLESIGSTLPEPFAKQPGSRWPLRIDWSKPRVSARAETVRVALRDDVRVVFERPAGQAPGRAIISVGLDAPLPASGVALAVRVPNLDIGAWEQALESPANASPGAGQFSLATGPIEQISLTTDSLLIGGKDLTAVVLGATRTDGLWRANLASREVNGQLEWQPSQASLPAGALRARFALLSVPLNRESAIEQILDTAPSRLPALDIEAQKLVLAGRDLGRLSLLASNAADGEHPTWRLDRLRIDHPGGTLDARGAWEPNRGAPRSTALDFELSLREPARILETFGITGAISGGGPGRLAGKVRWQGSPLAIDYPSLGGELDLQLGKGQFLKTEPGFGKLIGVLSLQSLPRRLSLDFRDVFAEGFSFDEIRGRASIASGLATTSDFRMRGVQAQVAIRGSVNLVDETQQLRVEVRPELNAGLASLAYAAVANPAIGLGTFLAQWALRKPLQEMFSYEYEVVGPWADPNVTERARPRFESPPPQAPR